MILRIGMVAVLLIACDGATATSPDPSGTPVGAGSASADAPSPPATARISAGGEASPLAVPPGFPVPPGAQSVVLSAADGSAVAAWTTLDDPPAVFDFYLEALPAAGYALGAAMPGGDAAIIRFTGPDGSAYQLDLIGHAPVRIALGPLHD